MEASHREGKGARPPLRQRPFPRPGHTHAAWLISAGVPLTAIQQRLGHSSIIITSDIYGGLFRQPHEVADAVIQAVLSGGFVPRPGALANATASAVPPDAYTNVPLDAGDAKLPGDPSDGFGDDEDDEDDEEDAA